MTTYNFKDITGKKFGRLVPFEKAPNRNGRTFWKCICDCGNVVEVRGEHIRNKATISCGCYSKESHKKHGKAKTPIYNVWQGIKDRCYNKKNPQYKYYGKRGIKMCDRWRYSFENFFNDMGNKPPKMTIDRIDYDGNYTPENCRWATVMQQVVNRRCVINYTFNGKTQCLKHWCKELNVPYSTALNRINKGKSVAEALCID